MTDADKTMIQDKAKRIVWSQSPPHRYTPKAIGKGPAWEIWDNLEDRSVPMVEIYDMMPDQLMSKITN